MENKELLKISNILITHPIKLNARQFDVVMYLGMVLQKREVEILPNRHIVVNLSRKELLSALSINNTINNNYFDNLFIDLQKQYFKYKDDDCLYSTLFISVYKREKDNIQIHIYEDMARLFLELKNKYTIIDFNILSKLTSTYSKKIYLLCMQYRNMQDYREFSIDDFKYIMGLEDKYNKVYNIKYRVLDVFKESINKIEPRFNFNYEIDVKKEHTIKFTFDFSFIPKQEPQQEQKASVFDNITPAEPLQYNKNKRVLKFEIPTEEQIYLHMQYSGARINVKEFIEFYNHRNWQNEQGKPIAWKSKVEKWNSKQDDEAFKRNAETFNKWEREYENKEKYSQMAEKLKPYNIDDMDFIKEMVDGKLENTFNWELGRLYETNEFRQIKGRQVNSTEYMFIDKWEHKYGNY